MKHFKVVVIALSTILVLAFSSCRSNSKHERSVGYDITVQGYVRDTLSLSQTDINLHFTKKQSIEKQLSRFYDKNGFYPTTGKLKLTSGNIEDDVDAYLKKNFGRYITYDITAQGYVEYSSFIRLDIDKEFKR
jgi:hypothetical protein